MEDCRQVKLEASVVVFEKFGEWVRIHAGDDERPTCEGDFGLVSVR